MKIGIDIRCLMNRNYSGVAEYTYNLLDNIFKIDNQNKYFLFYNSQKDISANLPRFDYPNVELRGFNYPNKFFNFSLRFFKKPQIDKLMGELDIFYTPNFNFLSLSTQPNKIITAHDISFTFFPKFFSKKRVLWHKFINPQDLLKLQNKIITVSQNTKNDLIKHYNIRGDKIKVIYSGVDHNLYKKLEDSDPKFQKVIKNYKLPENFILYLGTIEPRKNIETVIEAFSKLKTDKKFTNLSLVIAGDKGWKYKRVFKTAANSIYSKDINFIGYVEREDKPYLYNLAKIFIFPSFYEGFGLPVLEAQACGTPVITSLNSSLNEISNNSAYLINSDYVNQLKNAVCNLLTNQNLAAEYSKKGIANSQKFNWVKTAKTTLEFLKS